MKNTILMRDVLGLVLAGGQGERLYPLTQPRTKPAVPIAGTLRIIDFVLNNMIQSDIRKVYILTQYKSDSLNRYVSEHWDINNNMTGEFIRLIPPQMRVSQEWYKGTADAVNQNKHLIENHNPQYVAIFSGDHKYHMDIGQMIQYHNDADADITVLGKPMEKKDLELKDGKIQFGIIDTIDSKIAGFREKPEAKDVKERKVYVSMGNYIFNKDTLAKCLNDEDNDFGHDIIPKLVSQGAKVMMYDFSENRVPGMTEDREFNFWMDLGTLDSYYEANMMLIDISPKLNLYNKQWCLWEKPGTTIISPSKTIHADGIYEKTLDQWADEKKRISVGIQSLIGPGNMISGMTLKSVISRNVTIRSYARVINSIVFEGVHIERNCKIKDAIIDKNVKIPENTIIGMDKKLDIARGFTISPGGITVVPKGYVFEQKK